MKKSKALKTNQSPSYPEKIEFLAKIPNWLRHTFAQIEDKILWLNAKGKILYANRAAELCLGFSLENDSDKYIWDFDQNPQISSWQWSTFWLQLLDNQSIRYKSFYLFQQKDLVSVEVSVQAQPWENFTLALVQLKPENQTSSPHFNTEVENPAHNFRQILSDWKKAYQELQAHYDALYMGHTRSELANEALREGFWEIDLPDNLEVDEFTPIWYSDQFARLLGYEPEEFPPILKTWLEKIHPEERDKIFRIYKAFIKGSSPGDVYNTEYQLLTKEGKYRWFNARAKIQRDQNGKPIREAGALMDINFQKKAEKSLLKRKRELQEKNAKLLALSQELATQKQKSDDLNNLKDRLLSIISHDFRSPLNSLQGVLTLLQGKMISEEELRNLTERLLERVKVISTFLDNLLNWAKSQMEGTKVHLSRWNLHQVILTKMKLYQTQAEQKNIRLIAQIPENSKVYADLNMIELVIRNLISNAIKFSPQGASITLKVEDQPDNYVLISIADTGVGIDSDKITKLFGSENISTLGTANEPGTGLGLLLCKDFVEKNGGKIWVESTLGQGTCFYFTIPKPLVKN
jgi:PAS domain S-box-containing protein